MLRKLNIWVLYYKIPKQNSQDTLSNMYEELVAELT